LDFSSPRRYAVCMSAPEECRSLVSPEECGVTEGGRRLAVIAIPDDVPGGIPGVVTCVINWRSRLSDSNRDHGQNNMIAITIGKSNGLIMDASSIGVAQVKDDEQSIH